MSLVLAPIQHSPKTVTLPLAAAAVAPFACRINPFLSGNVVTALAGLVLAEGAPNTLTGGELVGCSVNHFTAKKHVRIVVTSADVTAGVGIIGQTAAAREAVTGNVTGDLLLTFGNAAGELIDSIPAHTNAADADTHLGLIVLVNGKPWGRIVDANAPAPATLEYCMDDNTKANYNITLGAGLTTERIFVGTEIDVFIGLNIGKCAERSGASGALIAGTTLAGGTAEERFLGVISSYTDTAGRSVTGLVASDFVMAETTPVALVGTGL